jgi:hypothetical protein
VSCKPTVASNMRMMPRATVMVLLGLLAFAVTSAPASVTGDKPSYARSNARLARATPHYPRAHLLAEESVTGGAGETGFLAVQRIYVLARWQAKRTVIEFYSRRLGRSWRRRGSDCLVSGSQVLVVIVHPTRRLGLMMDSRGAARCNELAALLRDLLEVDYPRQ